MRVLIAGAGAIGCYVGGLLAQAGHRTTLLGRPRLVAAIAQHGLRLRTGAATATLRNIDAVASLAQAFAESRSYDLGVLAVKSYDTAALLDELSAATPTAPPFLTLQNGVGNEEALAARLGAARVAAGVITTSVSVREVADFEVSRPGEVVLASMSGDAAVLPVADLVSVFAAAGLRCRQVGDYRALKWTKLFMNQLCNASCAIVGWTPAQIFADRQLADLEIRAWRETLTVMKAQGLALQDLGGYPFSLLGPVIRGLPGVLLRPLVGSFVRGGRGRKLPSLYLDLAAGKPQTEVAYLNGAVADAGERLGIATPVNLAFYRILHAMSEGRESWEAWRDQPQRLLRAVESELGITSGA